jgi:hypothetical protein
MSAATIIGVPNIGAVMSSMEQLIVLPPMCRQPQKFVVQFDEIKCAHSAFILNHPIELTLGQTDGGWLCEDASAKLPIYAFGETDLRAVYSFFEDFCVLWEEIAESPDDSLTDNAKNTKHYLLSLVRAVAVR